MTGPRDIFGRETRVGDTIAAGMSYGQSSVLRIGTVIGIKERDTNGSRQAWSVTVEWTHAGKSNPFYGSKKKTAIQIDSGYSYAKFVILPDGFTDEFPNQIG